MKHVLPLLLLLWFIACAAPTPTPALTPTLAPPLFVYADASLTNALRDVREAFALIHPDTRVEFTFVDSRALGARLDSSLSANLVVSAEPTVFANLTKQNRLDGAPRVFARNPLAIIIARTNPKSILNVQDLNRSGLRVVLAPPETRLGQHSRTLLENLNRAPRFRFNFSQQFLDAIIAQPSSGSSILNLVEQHRADVGIVYASDALLETNRVLVLELPAQSNSPEEFSVALLKANRDPARVQPLLDFLTSPQAQDILINHGFEPSP